MGYKPVVPIVDPPVLSLEHGHGVVGDNIREGSDVYLECRVKSRPKTENIIWIKDVGTINHSFWCLLLTKTFHFPEFRSEARPFPGAPCVWSKSGAAEHLQI